MCLCVRGRGGAAVRSSSLETGSAASAASSQSAVASRTMDDATQTLPALTCIPKVKSADLKCGTNTMGRDPHPVYLCVQMFVCVCRFETGCVSPALT